MLNTKRYLFSVLFAFIAISPGLGWAAKKPAKEYKPDIIPADFQTTVDNPYYPLVPGTTYKYLNETAAGKADIEVTVTYDTKVVMGVPCVVVHDMATRKGAVEEDTYDWYAQDKQGNVWYFGENTKEFDKDGKVKSTEGSWEGGVNGALPGIIMPGKPSTGDPYRQEYLKGVAEDIGQIVALDASAKVPAGSFSGCVKTKDWSAVEPGVENKWYAKGIGMIRARSSKGGDVEVENLVSVTKEAALPATAAPGTSSGTPAVPETPASNSLPAGGK